MRQRERGQFMLLPILLATGHTSNFFLSMSFQNEEASSPGTDFVLLLCSLTFPHEASTQNMHSAPTTHGREGQLPKGSDMLMAGLHELPGHWGHLPSPVLKFTQNHSSANGRAGSAMSGCLTRFNLKVPPSVELFHSDKLCQTDKNVSEESRKNLERLSE